MHEIKDIDLTESEKDFLGGLLELVERNLGFDGTNNIAGCREYFLSAMEPLIEAKQMVCEVDSGGILKDKDGNFIDVDLKLAIAQTEYKNTVIELKRNLNIVNELNNILDIASRIVLGKNHKYSKRITELKKHIKSIIFELNRYLVSGQKDVDGINKSPNPLDRSISPKHKK